MEWVRVRDGVRDGVGDGVGVGVRVRAGVRFRVRARATVGNKSTVRLPSERCVKPSR